MPQTKSFRRFRIRYSVIAGTALLVFLGLILLITHHDPATLAPIREELRPPASKNPD